MGQHCKAADIVSCCWLQSSSSVPARLSGLKIKLCASSQVAKRTVLAEHSLQSDLKPASRALPVSLGFSLAMIFGKTSGCLKQTYAHAPDKLLRGQTINSNSVIRISCKP